VALDLRSFLHLVEIRTKAASVLPFLFGVAFAAWRYGSFDPLNSTLMLLSLLAIDMATTATNNYADFRTARRREGYNYAEHNALAAYGLGGRETLAAILVLVAVAACFGGTLAWRTGLATFAIGAAAFLVGIAYSAGPIPISRTPLGEAFSGLAMGFVIPLLAVHVNALDRRLVFLSLDGWILTAGARLDEAAGVFLASLPLICGIADIMLANNLCDMEADAAEGRRTLPLAIGRGPALGLYAVLSFVFAAAVPAAVILGALPPTSLAALAAIVPVSRGVRKFLARQSKRDTFVSAVRNFAAVGVLHLAGTASGILLR
jgi:1,4-dihydroxy-2-naphthoate octaprenyltransferase